LNNEETKVRAGKEAISSIQSPQRRDDERREEKNTPRDRENETGKKGENGNA